MIWSTVKALADRTPQGRVTRTVGFRALQRVWHWPDDDATVAAIRTTLAAHGWTLRDNRTAPAPAERGAGIPALTADARYTAPDRPTLRARLQAPLAESTLDDWLWLVAAEARRWPESADFTQDDALQEGFLGLWHAWQAPSVDPTRPAFQWWDRAKADIRRSIHRAHQQQTRTVHIPRHIHALLAEIDTAHWTIAAAVGHEPTVDELATYLFLPVEQITDALRYRADVLSLDLPQSDDGGDDSGTLMQRIADPEAARAVDAVEAAADPIPDRCVPYLRALIDQGWTREHLAETTGWTSAQLMAVLGPPVDDAGDTVRRSIAS
jgi:DNA-directed RNA polymerase specialized sigma subunit